MRVCLVLALLTSLGGCAQGASDGTGGQSVTGSGVGGTTNSGGGESSGSFGGTGGNPITDDDPTTCAEAAERHTYVGCEFWPTITPNGTPSFFDFAVVLANGADVEALVVVTRGGIEVAKATVSPRDVTTIYLPWISELKGPDSDCGGSPGVEHNMDVRDGAYHLTTSLPVIAYQFSPLEYAPIGGPPGKDWSRCSELIECGLACFSYTNDASLLLPEAALTPNYRVVGYSGASTLTITGTVDGTVVDLVAGADTNIFGQAGTIIAGPNAPLSVAIRRGEVITLGASSLSGTLIKASQPVQVISGSPCANIPADAGYCDHLEETILPAETLGKHYFVTRPTGDGDLPKPYVVTIVGNVDGTTLAYPGPMPPGAPSTLNAGESVTLGPIETDFEVVANEAFAVATFLVGAELSSPAGYGDPSQSNAVTVEQYRTQYVFLAPTNYSFAFADVIQELDTKLTLNDVAVTETPTPISSGYGVTRIRLPPSANGRYLLRGTKPVGLQVIGYGAYTTYQFPGGLNLDLISEPPK